MIPDMVAALLFIIALGFAIGIAFGIILFLVLTAIKMAGR